MNVCLILFNRPDTVARVFASIRQARPGRLFLVADGPRPTHPGDVELVTASRRVVEHVDWPCDLQRNYSDVNLGCARRVASGLDWVFAQVEQAIILEDDCVPHPDFFPYCEALLEKYRHDERIMAISGDNFQDGQTRGDASYYFSRYMHCWGWASWRRAWQLFDYDLTDWPAARAGGLLGKRSLSEAERRYWTEEFDDTYHGAINTWAYRFMFCCWLHNGLTALPNVNLVSNIGCRSDATHTREPTPLANLPVGEIGPLRHPQAVSRCIEADEYTAQHVYQRRWHHRTGCA